MNRPGYSGGYIYEEEVAMRKRNRFSREFKERAVRLVFESQESYDTQAQAMQVIAQQLGCSDESLRRWVREAEGQLPAPAVEKPGPDPAARIRELERENRELKRSNEILRLASAFFAQAELDRLKN
jgi:transposase